MGFDIFQTYTRLENAHTTINSGIRVLGTPQPRRTLCEDDTTESSQQTFVIGHSAYVTELIGCS